MDAKRSIELGVVIRLYRAKVRYFSIEMQWRWFRATCQWWR